MKRIHIIGGKNHGKTTLIVELVQELSARGVRVGTIKHTHHEHELDLPGKDSYRHREAGAAVAGILSQSMNAVFWPPQTTDNSTSDSRYAVFEQIFADCDVVLYNCVTIVDRYSSNRWFCSKMGFGSRSFISGVWRSAWLCGSSCFAGQRIAYSRLFAPDCAGCVLPW